MKTKSINKTKPNTKLYDKNKSYNQQKFKLSKIFLQLFRYSTFAIIAMIISMISHLTIIQGYNTTTINVANTQAGYSTLLKAITQYPATNILFIITRPDNSEFSIQDITASDGSIDNIIYGKNLTISGNYKIYGLIKNSKTYTTTFEVKPSEASPSTSIIDINKTNILPTNQDDSIITIYLRDLYNNPIPNHEISMITTHPNTTINYIHNTTDEKGSAKAIIYTSTQGNMEIEIFDKTSNIPLNKKINIKASNNISGINTQYLMGDISQTTASGSSTSTSSISTYNNTSSKIKLIINTNSEAEINKDFTVRVRAVDNNGKTVSTYKGTIKFESSDPQASLPSDFTFTDQDKGSRTFSLSVKLKTPGIQMLTVKDTNDISIEPGTAEINVLGDNLPSTKPIILSPQNKTYINQTKIDVNATIGSGSKLTNVDLYDKENFLKTIQSNNNGEVNVNIDNLSEGEHIFTMKYKPPTTNNNTQTYESNPVTIYADFTAPVYYGSIDFSKQQGNPNDTVDISLVSEANLKKAQLIINEQAYELQSSESINNNRQTYKTTIILPIDAKKYDIKLELVDQAGNNNVFENIGSITVIPTKSKMVDIQELSYVFKCTDLVVFFPPVLGATHYQIKYDSQNTSTLEKVSAYIYPQTDEQHIQYSFQNINMSNQLYVQAIAFDHTNEIIGQSQITEITDTPDIYLKCEQEISPIKSEVIEVPKKETPTIVNVDTKTGSELHIIVFITLIISLIIYIIPTYIKNNNKIYK